jgi:RNA polymerase sigma-70 factor (ECF subfamily)
MPWIDDRAMLMALRDGDEAAFQELIDTYSASLLGVARLYVDSHSVAEEVVQETWLGVLRSLDRFEERSSLKTWIFKILTNVASRRGMRERRTVPFSALADVEAGEEEGSGVDPDRFLPADHDRWPHHWALGPTRWETPEEGLLSGETRGQILDAIEALPPAQRTVITLRDVQGWPSSEVCETLGLSESNQRVLLHRARSKVRGALEQHFDAVELTVA